MQLLITVPLFIETAMQSKLELMPVVMKTMPSSQPALYTRFIKAGGQRIPLSPNEINRCQRYMKGNDTEALSEDGSTAFTISGTALVECSPENIEQLEELS